MRLFTAEKSVEVERHGKIVIEMIPKKTSSLEVDLLALRKKYYGSLPNFPDVTKYRANKKWKKIFD